MPSPVFEPVVAKIELADSLPSSPMGTRWLVIEENA